MSTDEKAAAVQAENIDAKPKRRGCLGHCLKFWWAYLAGFIAIVILVVCLIIFVAVPKIAQSKLDDAELTIQGIAVSSTESNQLNMAINSTIRTDGSVHADIDGFIGVMYLEDLEPHTPFASINFPATTADALQTVNVSQLLEIKDMDALTTFNKWLLTNESVRITTYGETKVKVKGISKKYGVTFKKTIETPGLRGFAGTTVYDSYVNLTGDADGNNFFGKTNIPNYSVFTLEIGNATFNNYLFDKLAGTVFIDNILLRPGMDNEFDMKAQVDNGQVLEALGKEPYCKEGGILPFQLSGKTVFNDGQSLTYFADALASHNQTIDIDIGTPVSKLLGNPIPCGGLGGGD